MDTSIFDRLVRGTETLTPKETKAVAEEIARQLPPSAIIALHGDLGTGKTTFVKGLASAWGIERPVTSPTFNLCNLYQGTRVLIHMDAYRLGPDPEALDSLSIEDWMKPPFCLAIEWAENLGTLPWPTTLSLQFDGGTSDRRTIRSL